MLKYIPELTRKRMYRREFLEDWVDGSGRLVLMSEAAYPILVQQLTAGSLFIILMLLVFFSRTRRKVEACK